MITDAFMPNTLHESWLFVVGRLDFLFDVEDIEEQLFSTNMKMLFE